MGALEMKPNYLGLDAYLVKHPDYVFESEVREQGLIDFVAMEDGDMNEFLTWLNGKGYEMVEYVDKQSRLLDTVWVNEKHQEAISQLLNLTKKFSSLRSYPRAHISNQRIDRIAYECIEILTTLHSMVLVTQESEPIQ